MQPRSKGHNIALWIASGLMAALFVMAGTTKLFGPGVENFAKAGYPAWFAYLIAVGELAGGLLLLWPRAASIAASWLVVIMLGAIYTHAHTNDLVHSPPAIIALVLCSWIAWERRGESLLARRSVAPSP